METIKSTLSLLGAAVLALGLTLSTSHASTFGSEGAKSKITKSDNIQLAQKDTTKGKTKKATKKKAKTKKVAAKKSACKGLAKGVCTASKSCHWVTPKAKKGKKTQSPYCRTVAKAKPKAKKASAKKAEKKTAKKTKK